jgi:hypothetical protein
MDSLELQMPGQMANVTSSGKQNKKVKIFESNECKFIKLETKFKCNPTVLKIKKKIRANVQREGGSLTSTFFSVILVQIKV